MAITSMDGGLFLLRWAHLLAGITWIGLLYHLTFVQTPFLAEAEASVRSAVIQRLVPRALWWFRWSAMVTFLSGWLFLLHRVPQVGFVVSYSWAILLGGLLGSLLWVNAWFVVWPAQRLVMRNAMATAAGQPDSPAAAAAGARAALVSRTSAALSIPMLFFMGAASHLPGLPVPRSGLLFWTGAMLVVLLAEVNGLAGTPGRGAARPLASVRGTVGTGFGLAAVLYAWFEVLRP